MYALCGEYAQTSGEGTQSSDEGCEGGSENREEGYRNHQSDASDACSLCCDRNCDRGDPGCRYQFCSEQKNDAGNSLWLKRKKRKKSNVVLNIIIALAFLAGAGVFLYPTISDMWNQYRNAQLVSKYEEAVTELSDNDYDRLWKEAKEYNAEHPVNAIVDAFEEEDTYELSHPYDGVLDPNGDGLMGSIRDSKRSSEAGLSITELSKTVLEKGVGHVRAPVFLSEARAPMRSGGASRSS